MIFPIYQLLFGKHEEENWKQPSLELVEDQVAISYKTYKSDDENDMQGITDQKLTPGRIAKKWTLHVPCSIEIKSPITAYFQITCILHITFSRQRFTRPPRSGSSLTRNGS